MVREWKNEEIEFLKEEYRNYTLNEFAYGFQRSTTNIRMILKKLGLKKERYCKPIKCVITKKPESEHYKHLKNDCEVYCTLF